LNELRQLLERTGTTPTGLSKLTEHDPRRIRQWCCGARVPPDALVKQMRQYAKYADKVFKKGDSQS